MCIKSLNPFQFHFFLFPPVGFWILNPFTNSDIYVDRTFHTHPLCVSCSDQKSSTSPTNHYP